MLMSTPRILTLDDDCGHPPLRWQPTTRHGDQAGGPCAGGELVELGSLTREQRRAAMRLLGIPPVRRHAEPPAALRPDRRRFLGACAAASIAPFAMPAQAGLIDRLLMFLFGGRITKAISQSIGVAFSAAQQASHGAGLLEWIGRIGAVLWAAIGAHEVGLIPEPRQLVALARERLSAVLDWARGDPLPTTVGLPALEPADSMRLIGVDVTAVDTRTVGRGVTEAEARARPPLRAAATLALAPGRALQPAVVPMSLPLLPPGEFYVASKLSMLDSSAGEQFFASAHAGTDQVRLVRVS